MARTSADLFAAIEAADVDGVRGILAEDPSLATSRDAEGVSALLRARYRLDRGLAEAVRAFVTDLDPFEAASFGDLDRLTHLLDADPSLAGEHSPDGFTLLHLSAFFGQVDAVALLLARGAEVDARGTGWMTGTPLHSAASASQARVATALLEAGADPNARQSGGWTPLHAAAANGSAATTRTLLERGADPTMEADDGRDATHLARESGDAETIAVLGAQAET
jgi:uncharacterized protein